MLEKKENILKIFIDCIVASEDCWILIFKSIINLKRGNLKLLKYWIN